MKTTCLYHLISESFFRFCSCIRVSVLLKSRFDTHELCLHDKIMHIMTDPDWEGDDRHLCLSASIYKVGAEVCLALSASHRRDRYYHETDVGTSRFLILRRVEKS